MHGFLGVVQEASLGEGLRLASAPGRNSLCVGLGAGDPLVLLSRKEAERWGGAGWSRVGRGLGQVEMRGTLGAQKEWEEFGLILSEWEGFLQGV